MDLGVPAVLHLDDVTVREHAVELGACSGGVVAKEAAGESFVFGVSFVRRPGSAQRSRLIEPDDDALQRVAAKFLPRVL